MDSPRQLYDWAGAPITLPDRTLTAGVNRRGSYEVIRRTARLGTDSTDVTEQDFGPSNGRRPADERTAAKSRSACAVMIHLTIVAVQ